MKTKLKLINNLRPHSYRLSEDGDGATRKILTCTITNKRHIEWTIEPKVIKIGDCMGQYDAGGQKRMALCTYRTCQA